MKAGLIYMASGFGKRFGTNKLLEEFQGRPLYAHGLSVLLQVQKELSDVWGWEVKLTVVSQYEEIRRYAEELGADVRDNPESSQGITSSIRIGTKAFAEDTELYLYAVADQPGMRPERIAAFLREFAVSGKGIGCMECEGRRGNPAVFRGRYRGELLRLTGDRGGSQLMKRYPEEVWTFAAEASELEDVDTWEDLRRLL